MVEKAHWAVATLFVVLLSGCMDASDVGSESLAADSVPAIPLTNTTNVTNVTAVVLEPTRDDWYSLPLTATPEGSLAGFRIPIPNGSSVPTWYDEEKLHPVMEFFILGDGALDAFHILAMDANTGTVAEEIIMVNAEGDGFPFSGGGAGVGVNEWSSSTSIGGDYVYLEGLADGDEVAITVGAVGSGNATLGLRFSEENPFAADQFIWPSEDRAEFLDRASVGTRLELEPTGVGTGLSASMFYDSFRIYLLPDWTQFIAGDMQLDDRIPTAPARVATDLTASVPSSSAAYASSAALVWTEAHEGVAEIALHGPGGEEAATSGPLIPDPIVSSKVALMRGSGDGDTAASMSVTMAGAPTLFPQLLFLVHIQTGTPIADLVGVEPESTESTYGGLLDLVPVPQGVRVDT